jgi:putative phage-type endonuclease
MGKSRWTTPFGLWCEKTLKLPAKDLSGNEAAVLGSELEEFVAQKFSRETGKPVRRAPVVYVHDEYPFLKAHVDRLVTGTDEIVECKTCSAYKKDEWEGNDIPQVYIFQAVWNLGISKRRICNVPVLMGGQKFVHKPVEFDAELFDLMVEAAVDFWLGNVENDAPPPLTDMDNDTLASLYAVDNGDMIDLTGEDEAAVTLDEALAQLQELKMHAKEIDTEKGEIEVKIKDIIKEASGIQTSKYKVTWKSQTSTKVDTQKLKDDGIYEEYSTQSSFRVLRITKKQGGIKWR